MKPQPQETRATQRHNREGAEQNRLDKLCRIMNALTRVEWRPPCLGVLGVPPRHLWHNGLAPHFVCPLPAGPDSEPWRSQCIEDLLQVIPRPINSAKWNQDEVGVVARREAETHQRSIDDEIELRMRSALFEILVELPERRGGLDLEPAHELRARLDRRLSEDLMGPEWRSGRLDPSKLGELADQQSVPEGPDAELMRRDSEVAVLELIERAGLTNRERQIAVVVSTGQTQAEAARQLGIAAGTARALWHRAKKKILEIRAAP